MIQTAAKTAHSSAVSTIEEKVKTVETLTCVYHPLEDRLLLALNYQSPVSRADFWITRSFLLKLLPIFFQHSDSTYTQKKEPSIIEEKSSPSVTQTDGDMFALTQTDPALLESVDVSYNGDEITLTFKNLNLSLFYRCRFTQQTFDNFVSMVTHAAPTFEWGIQGW